MTIFKDQKSLPIVGIKFASLVVLVFLAACDGKDSRDRRGTAIVLECSGHEIDLKSSERKPTSYLIKIDPQNQFQRSIHFFSSDEKRFVSPCESVYPECKLFADADLITETGVMRGSDNKVMLTKMTDINRRTGSMKVVVSDPLDGQRTKFEGSCKKAELPHEEPQKF